MPDNVMLHDVEYVCTKVVAGLWQFAHVAHSKILHICMQGVPFITTLREKCGALRSVTTPPSSMH